MDANRYPRDVVDRVLARRGRLHAFESLESARTALLVVDMQTGFLREGSPGEMPSAREIVPGINRLADATRAAGGQVVWIISTYGPNESDRWPVLFDHIMSPERAAAFRGILTEGVEDHAVWPLLRQADGDAVVAKNRFSGFVGSAGRLESLLRERGIDTVLIVGTVTNVCCESTAREAAMLDFKTIMVSDANAGRSEAEDIETYSVFLAAFGDVMTADEVIALLEAGPSGNEQAASAAQ